MVARKRNGSRISVDCLLLSLPKVISRPLQKKWHTVPRFFVVCKDFLWNWGKKKREVINKIQFYEKDFFTYNHVAVGNVCAGTEQYYREVHG